MDQHLPAIASASLGWHQTHTLTEKANAAAKHGFKAIEVVFSDLERSAVDVNESLEHHALTFKSHCDRLGLGILSLAPFENFEGSPLPLAHRIRTTLQWVQIARTLDASFIQIPASYETASLRVSEDTVIEELRLLADCGLPSPRSNEKTIEFAYEPMSWSVRTDTWQHALYIKRRVDRANFKLCLDTYHIFTKLWADCSSPDGRIPGGDAAMKASLFKFLRHVRPTDVGFVQLSDMELAEPSVSFRQLREAGQHQGLYWSARGRIFPYETEHGAYLPMADVIRTWLVELGWSGWVSMEIFHSSMANPERGPAYWADRGMKSWEKVQAKMLVMSSTVGVTPHL